MKIRIGIDVGGTFTHAVAIDNTTLEILDFAVTPTTHKAIEGVALGVVESFLLLTKKLDSKNIKPDEIIFVAHSTTQATNALLEGDVSSVGIIALGTGLEGSKTKSDANIPPIETAKGRFIKTDFAYLDTSSDWKTQIQKTVSKMKEDGVGCIAASEAFSVDDPSNENYIKECASSSGIPSCGTHEMSGLYGLRVRTKTAVINASILPKMVETANMTQESLIKANISSPLMVMRSDGGVMSVDEMRRRPLLTLLSGPSAGIAAALTYIKATDAIFLETGGTSTDITVIKNGKAVIRSAVIGGHTTYMKTLDCRTCGIAGGSMVQVSDAKIKAVGPRSAHIAGLKYVSFSDAEELSGNLKVISVRPLDGDPDYLALENEDGVKFAITTTCCANLLGFIKEGDYSYGNQDSILKAFGALETFFAKTKEEIAHEIMDKAVEIILPVVKELIKDYELSDRRIRLIGGGGGCYSIVPYAAKTLGFEYELAKHAEVVSAIGSAMAMLRDTVEKNIFSPKPEDVEKVRQEAFDSVLAMGANPESIEVHVEVDGQKNIVRAIAMGSIEFKAQDLLISDVGNADRVYMISSYFAVEPDKTELLGNTSALYIYRITTEKKLFFNIFKSKRNVIVVSDAKGSLKQQVPSGTFYETTVKKAGETLKHILETHREYGDAGAIAKGVFLICGHKITDLTSVAQEEQIISLAEKEISALPNEEKIYFIAV